MGAVSTTYMNLMYRVMTERYARKIRQENPQIKPSDKLACSRSFVIYLLLIMYECVATVKFMVEKKLNSTHQKGTYICIYIMQQSFVCPALFGPGIPGT